MKTETLTRTVICKLETSQRKNDRLRRVIDEWQSIAQTVADYHASFPDYEWGRTKQNPSFYRIATREHPDYDIYANAVSEAVHKVGDAFDSWRENGKAGDRPQFGDGDYARFKADDITIEANDRGWGLQVKLFPRTDAEWWHINAGPYQREYLEGITDGEMDHGTAELHLKESGDLYCHLAVNEEVAVLKPGDVKRWVGVDLGENTLYAVAAVDGEVEAVELQSGREFRHHRDRLERKRERLSEQGDLRGVRKTRGEREKYTDHMTHVASREIVDFAADHAPCGIRLEDLTDYRKTADDPIHDWPFAEIQAKVAYKAAEAGLPVEMVDPEATSITCRKCGHKDPWNRGGDTFNCVGCGYEVHADVNAAINIAVSE